MDTLLHRKANARLRLTDPDGLPLANQSVEFHQTTHDFLFGCGAFDTLVLMQADDPLRRVQCEARVNKWLSLFNYGTLPFYWGRYEHVPGKTLKEPMMAAASYLKEHGVTLKGHPLCWHTVCADWLLRYDNAEILRRQIERIHREVGDFQGLIDMWDVINELVIMPRFDKYDNAITRICKEKGRIALARDVFTAARQANPHATLLINDFETGDAYEILIEGLLEAGVPIDVIGIQSHQHQGYWGREKVESVLERYARFGLPLHFTENTLISGDLMPGHIVDLNDYQVSEWPSTEEGEARQASEMTEMYTLLFSHPQVQAITAWDFTDNCWLHAPAGLLRKDDTAKPAYDALKSLIHGAWETHEKRITDADGCVTLMGFKGSYAITCGTLKASLALDEDTTQTIIMVRE